MLVLVFIVPVGRIEGREPLGTGEVRKDEAHPFPRCQEQKEELTGS